MRQALLRPGVRFMVLALASGVGTSLGAQTARVPGTVVIGTAGDAALPIPFIGTSNSQNANVADQLFLHLGVLTPPYRTSGDAALTPMLARSWRRVDSLTLTFELDPRAHWHDGSPVTAHDVVFTWGVASNPKVNPSVAALESVASVEETGPRTIRVRFRRAYPEQLYRFGFEMQTLPAHLLERMSAESISTSQFASHPVGNGPYVWTRRVPGQLVELHADTAFFLGRPGIARVIFSPAGDPTARLNKLLSGETDVMEQLLPPDLAQLAGHPQLRTVRFSSNALAYALFNQRSATDTSLPNRILTDARIRAALTLTLDRRAMATAVFGATAQVPDAAESQLWSWITGGTISGTPQNVARATTLLAAAGWRDTDGDGTLDKGGIPLKLAVIYPEASASRVALALQVQAMWKVVGVAANLQPVPGPVWVSRRNSGQFDVDIVTVNQDASPGSLIESWSCATARATGSSNKGHWCDPTFDQLINAALRSTAPAGSWRSVLKRMADQHPAAFLASPSNVVAVHTRYENVTVLPVRQWLSLWQWRVKPSAALARDR